MRTPEKVCVIEELFDMEKLKRLLRGHWPFKALDTKLGHLHRPEVMVTFFLIECIKEEHAERFQKFWEETLAISK